MYDLRAACIFAHLGLHAPSPPARRWRNLLLMACGFFSMGLWTLAWFWSEIFVVFLAVQILLFWVAIQALQQAPPVWQRWTYSKSWPQARPQRLIWYSDGASASTRHEALEHLQAFPPTCLQQTTASRVFAGCCYQEMVYLLRLEYVPEGWNIAHTWSVVILARRSLEDPP